MQNDPHLVSVGCNGGVNFVQTVQALSEFALIAPLDPGQGPVEVFQLEDWRDE